MSYLFKKTETEEIAEEISGERELTIDVDSEYITDYTISKQSNTRYSGGRDFSLSLTIIADKYEGDLSCRVGHKFTMYLMKGDHKMLTIDNMKVTSVTVDESAVQMDLRRDPN